MKTPRELLLARHRHAEPQLGAMRAAAVAAVGDRDAGAGEMGKRRTRTVAAGVFYALETPWRELVLPSRRLWGGLVTVWALIFIVNFADRNNVSSVTGRPVRSAPVMMSFQTQRLMGELLADRVTPADADRPRNTKPRPRTEKSIQRATSNAEHPTLAQSGAIQRWELKVAC